MAELASTATEYVYATVSNIDPVTQLAKDLSTATVSMAFVARGIKPGSGDWKSGGWSPGYPPYVARVLVGPDGTVTLAIGKYDVWTQVSLSGEVAQMPSGFLRIT